jgi:hypothetical protein
VLPDALDPPLDVPVGGLVGHIKHNQRPLRFAVVTA